MISKMISPSYLTHQTREVDDLKLTRNYINKGSLKRVDMNGNADNEDHLVVEYRWERCCKAEEQEQLLTWMLRRVLANNLYDRCIKYVPRLEGQKCTLPFKRDCLLRRTFRRSFLWRNHGSMVSRGEVDLESIFDQFYPGSKREEEKHPEKKPAKLCLLLLGYKSVTKKLGGKETEMFTIGALCSSPGTSSANYKDVAG